MSSENVESLNGERPRTTCVLALVLNTTVTRCWGNQEHNAVPTVPQNAGWGVAVGKKRNECRKYRAKALPRGDRREARKVDECMGCLLIPQSTALKRLYQPTS